MGFCFRLNLVKSEVLLCSDRGSDTRSCVLVQLRDASWSNSALLDRSSERPEGVTGPHESATTLSPGRPGGSRAAATPSTDRDPTVLHQLCAVLLHRQHTRSWVNGNSCASTLSAAIVPSGKIHGFAGCSSSQTARYRVVASIGKGTVRRKVFEKGTLRIKHRFDGSADRSFGDSRREEA